MTFLLCVAVFVAVSCLGLPLLLLALFAVWNPEPEQASSTLDQASTEEQASIEEDQAPVAGRPGRRARIDFSRTTV